MTEKLFGEQHILSFVNALLITFCLGVLLAAKAALPQGVLIGLAVIALGCLVVGAVKKSYAFVYGLLLLFFLLGIMRLLHNAALPSDDIGFSVGKNLVVSGSIVEPPRAEEKENGVIAVRYTVKIEQAWRKGREMPLSGEFLLYAKQSAAAGIGRMGDKVKAEGEVRAIHGYGNPGLIDRATALKRKGITAQIFADKDSVRLEMAEGWRLDGYMDGLRRRLLAAMEKVMPKDDAAAIFAMLLGGYGGIKPELLEAFTATGIVHILSVSGSHIALLAGTLEKIFRLLKVRSVVSVTAIIAVILLYGFFAGFVPPVIRSCAMGILTFGALALGREKDARQLLSLTGLGMLAIQPQLLFDISFQLSFGATAGLLYLSPPVQQALCFLPKWLAANLALTVAAQMSVLPFLAWYFNTLSISSLAANILVVPVVESIIVIGLLGLVLGAVVPFGQSILFVLCSLTLGLVYHMTGAMAAIPYGNIYLPSGGLWAGFAYYGALSLLVWKTAWVKKIFSRRAAIGMVGLALVAGLFYYRAGMANAVTVHFIDVGQGDAALVVTPSGKAVLIDTGGVLQRQNGFDIGERVVVPYLKHYGVTELSYLILTHAHEDHAGGAKAVCRRLRVEHVIIGREDRRLYAKVFGTSVEQLPESCVPAYAGQKINIDGVDFTVVAAADADGKGAQSGNEVSSVIKAVHGKNSFLFTGDLDADGEKKIIESESDIGSSVLKVAHHGSKSSTSDAFVQSVRPRYAVISVGADNTFGHPNGAVLSKLAAGGAELYRTDRDGAVVFTSDGETLRVASFRRNG